MKSIRDFTDQELGKQIKDARADLDASEYGTGDYNAAKAELAVAEREKQRRKSEHVMSGWICLKLIRKQPSLRMIMQKHRRGGTS